MSLNNTLQKTFLALLAGLILGLGPTQSVKAQFFGISLDTAIGYSAAKKGVIGGSVGITPDSAGSKHWIFHTCL